MTTAPAPQTSPNAAPADASLSPSADLPEPGSSPNGNPAHPLIRAATLVSRLLWFLAILAPVQAGIALPWSGTTSEVLNTLITSTIFVVFYVTLARVLVLIAEFGSTFLRERSPTATTDQAARAELSRIAAALEQIAIEVKDVPRSAPYPNAATDFRRESITRFEQALASGDLTLSLTLLETYIAEFPQDDATHLRAQLDAARAHETKKQTALLDAARQVNDPDRVLEIFNSLKSTLDDEPRQTLERELARWFLSLVHRRLRSGTIQADVVTLAQKVSENFGSTVEGASLRAALPTMRRSVGLCPRCAQPYTGSADACPRCLTAPSTPGSRLEQTDTDDPEFDDDSFDDSDSDDLPLNHLAIDDADLDNLRLIDPELDDDADPDRRV